MATLNLERFTTLLMLTVLLVFFQPSRCSAASNWLVLKEGTAVKVRLQREVTCETKSMPNYQAMDPLPGSASQNQLTYFRMRDASLLVVDQNVLDDESKTVLIKKSTPVKFQLSTSPGNTINGGKVKILVTSTAATDGSVVLLQGEVKKHTSSRLLNHLTTIAVLSPFLIATGPIGYMTGQAILESQGPKAAIPSGTVITTYVHKDIPILVTGELPKHVF